MVKNIAIFASGSGTNAENIANYFRNKLGFSIKLIVTNKSDAFVIERAKRLNIDSAYISKQDWNNQEQVITLLDKYQIDFIVLAGFLLKIPKYLLDKYPGRIINIHPALLPKYGGKGMYGDKVHQAVIEAGEVESGITIHYCNEHYDEGNIIFQAKCQILPTDSYKDVAKKVHELEYIHFPNTIEKLLLDINSKS